MPNYSSSFKPCPNVARYLLLVMLFLVFFDKQALEKPDNELRFGIKDAKLKVFGSLKSDGNLDLVDAVSEMLIEMKFGISTGTFITRLARH